MIGNVDLIEDNQLHGWHRDVESSDALMVEVDGQFIGIVTMALDRPDVLASGHAGLRTGFAIEVPERFLDGAVHDVTVRGSAPDSRVEAVLPFPLLARAETKTADDRVERAGPRSTSRAAVVCWDLGHNPAGRAFVLVRMLQEMYDVVDLIGPLHPRFGARIWPPLVGERNINIIAQRAEGYGEISAFAAKVAEQRYDFVHICKPRMSALLIGWRIGRTSDCAVALDIDDDELSFFPQAFRGAFGRGTERCSDEARERRVEPDRR